MQVPVCKLIYRYIKKRLFSCDNVSLQVTAAMLFFAIGIFFTNPVTVVINLLYFVIILEVTRMIVEYIQSRNHRVKIRYLVDASFVAIFREIIIIIVDSHHLSEHWKILAVYISLSFVVLFIRYLVMKISPDEYESEYQK